MPDEAADEGRNLPVLASEARPIEPVRQTLAARSWPPREGSSPGW